MTNFTRIAVLNRGEPAVRFLRALREYNLEHNAHLEAVVFYTEVDQNAPFVRQATIAVPLGHPLRVKSDGSSISAYIDHDFIISLLKREQCDAVWPGWGFLSEDASFVKKLEQLNITFLGPSSQAMAGLGDKIAAKYLAEKCNVPLAPWVEWKESWNQEKLFEEAQKIGFPLMVKASGGGGGRGIRKVHRQEDLEEAIAIVVTEVEKFFGQGGILLEKCISQGRHIEVQFAATNQGKAFALGIRDCSIQRKNQKVIEEAPSPILPIEMQEQLYRSTEKLAQTCGYVGVGTAEFLYQPQTGLCSFLEVNSRLQVEHTITEAITGLDLVQAQIQIARGKDWKPENIIPRGHAIELRVNAETPEKDFAPAPGKLIVFRPPSGPGVRVDSGVTEGSEISEFFDSMIAKIIVWAPNRKQCIARALRACQELDAVVEDGATNQAFLTDVLTHKEFIEAKADTSWLDRAMQDGSVVTIGGELEAVLAAAILEYKLLRKEEINKFFSQNQDGIPFLFPKNQGKKIELRLRGIQYSLDVGALNEEEFLVGKNDLLHSIRLRIITPNIAEMWLEDNWHKILYSYGSSGITVELDGYSHTIERSSGGVVKSPAPAVIVGVSVEVGELVDIGDRICTLEAMKMEMGVFATERGIIKEVLCQVNQQVLIGDALVLLELEEEEEESIEQEYFPAPFYRILGDFYRDGLLSPLNLHHLEKEKQEQAVDGLRQIIQAALLGFDLLPQISEQLEQFFQKTPLLKEVSEPKIWLKLLPLLDLFSDTIQLLNQSVLLEIDSASTIPANIAFYDFCRQHHEEEDAVKEYLKPLLSKALSWYQIQDFKADDGMREALFRLALGNDNNEQRHQLISGIIRLFITLHEAGLEIHSDHDFFEFIDKTGQSSHSAYPFVQDNAIHAHYLFFERQKYKGSKQEVANVVEQLFRSTAPFGSHSKAVRVAMKKLARSTQELQSPIWQLLSNSDISHHRLSEALTRRFYLGSKYSWLSDGSLLGSSYAIGKINGKRILSIITTLDQLQEQLAELDDSIQIVEAILKHVENPPEWEDYREELIELAPNSLHRITISWFDPQKGEKHRSLISQDGQFQEKILLRNIHPEAAQRIHIEQLENFDLERIYTHEHIYAFLGKAKNNPRDERIFVMAEVFGKFAAETDFPLWEFEQVFFEAIQAMREMQSKRTKRSRLQWNWIFFHVHPILKASQEQLYRFSKRLEPYTRDLNLREVRVRLRLQRDRFRYSTLILRRSGNSRLTINWQHTPIPTPLSPVSTYEMRVIRAQKFGHVYPYEIISMLEGSSNSLTKIPAEMGRGRFQEYDLDESNQVIPIFRPFGNNICSVVIGLITNSTAQFPEGMTRVWIASDSTKSMGALAEKECRRIIAAIDLAEKLQIPIEWIPISAGAMISMDSGTENLDWTAKVLRRIIRFTQQGGIINLIIHGINVGAQSYWNAEASMLMHTKGTLIMTTQAAMVLTGKKALDFSGGVSAEDEKGIGGAKRIMAPNGQAQFVVDTLEEAYQVLFRYYQYTYRKGKQAPKMLQTQDSTHRSILSYPYSDARQPHFSHVGDIFSAEHNPERKKPYAIRQVMQAVIDQDHKYLEKFSHLSNGESSVIWLAHLGGHPVSLIGIESQPIPRRGRIPLHGPDTWTGGTLFPQSSKKIARAINSASGIHPIVVLANLSGFDGSPESLQKLQLEYGAEIGRAVVNFDGPIIFVVIGRYHGGAYVVFSKALNPNLIAIALEGSFASVIGGAPAAAVVFSRKVKQLVNSDQRILEMREKISKASSHEKVPLREQFERLQNDITLEKRGEIAKEFDQIHSVERAIQVGSLDAVIKPRELRARIIEELRTNTQP